MFVFNAFHPVLFQTVVFILIHWCQAQSDVVAPSQPIVAAVGDDVTLPCRLEPPVDASAMTVEWTRPDSLRRFVLVWRDGEELGYKHESYQGRTSLFTEGLKDGNVSLKLLNVVPSDDGTYRCFVPALNRAAAVELVVGSVSSPMILNVTTDTGGLVLECRSSGWFPEPELLWLDAEGNLLSAGPTETVRGSDDLYTVSSRVTVEKRHSSRYTCRVQQRTSNQTRDAHIHVTAADVFPGQTGSRSSSGSSVLVIVGLILCIMFLLGAAALVVWRRRKNKLGKKQQDEETQNKSGADESVKEPLMETEPDGKQVTRQTVENQNQTETKLDETHDQCVMDEETQNEPRDNQSEKETLEETEPEVTTLMVENQKEETQTGNNLQPEKMETKHDQRLMDAETQMRENNRRSKETNEAVETDKDQFRAERIENQNKMEETETGNNLKGDETKHDETQGQRLVDEETQNNPTGNQSEKEPLVEIGPVTEQAASQTMENHKEETQTVNNLQPEKMEPKHDQTHDHCVADEEQDEEVMVEKEILGDADTEIEKLKKKLQKSERDEKEHDRKLSRLLRQKKDKDKLIKDVKKQLKEMETQREAAETRQEAEDTKKVELEKELGKMEEKVKTMMKDIVVVTEKKHKATSEREESVKNIEDLEKLKNENLQTIQPSVTVNTHSDSDDSL